VIDRDRVIRIDQELRAIFRRLTGYEYVGDCDSLRPKSVLTMCEEIDSLQREVESLRLRLDSLQRELDAAAYENMQLRMPPR
jgi:hypothetical protein